MREFLRRSMAVARLDTLEFFRQRPSLGIFFQPLMFLGFAILLPGFLNAHINASAAAHPTVAWQAPASADGLGDALRAQGLHLRVSTEVVKDVRDAKDDVGVIAAADGSLRVVVAKTRTVSRTAYGTVERAIGDVDLERSGLRARLTVHHVLLARTAHGQELTFAQFLPFYLVAQLMSVLGIGLSHFAGNNVKRCSEPLLVLPLRRSEIAVGKCLFACAAGLLSLAAMFVPLIVLDVLPFPVAGVNVAFSAATFVALVFGALLLLPVMASAGVLAGSRSRTPTEASVLGGTLGTLPMLASFAFTFILRGNIPSWAFALPLLGHQALLREATRHAVSPLHALVVVTMTAALTAAALYAAGRLLRRPRAVLRVS